MFEKGARHVGVGTDSTPQLLENSPSTAFLSRFRRRIGWVLAAYWLALFIGTHIPLPQLKEMPRFSDKLMHFGAYAGLAFLLGLWISARRGLTRGIPWGVLLIVALYGIADELLQIPVNRSAEVADWAADMLGSSAGLYCLAIARRLFGTPLQRRFGTSD